MAHHKSAIKRIRQSRKKRLHNRYYSKTMRNLIRKVRSVTDKSEATKLLPETFSSIDREAKKNRIHPNKAANLKSSLTKHVNSL